MVWLGRLLGASVSLLLAGTLAGHVGPGVKAPAREVTARVQREPAAAPFAVYVVDDPVVSEELGALTANDERLFPELTPSGRRAPCALDPERGCAPEVGEERDEPAPSRRRKPAWTSGLQPASIPIPADPRIARYLRYFSESAQGRKMFVGWLRRSGGHRAVIEQALRRWGLPPELVALVFIESGFSPKALSSAGAAGLWQFMPRTGRAYGLRIGQGYDERRDVAQASEAGAHHLADLHEHYGSWDLALAAYNYGFQRLDQRLEEMGVDDFWELSSFEGVLPRETSLYVPKIYAVMVLLQNLERFGFQHVTLDAAVDTVPLEVPAGTDLSMVARAAGTSLRALRGMNPAVLSAQVPRDVARVNIPARGESRAKVMLPELLAETDGERLDRSVGPDFDWGVDELPTPALPEAGPAFEQTMARGQAAAWQPAVARVAERFGGAARPLPLTLRVAADDPEALEGGRVAGMGGGADEKEREAVYYRVGDQDTASGIAREWGLTVKDVRRAAGGALETGQLLRLEVRGHAAERLRRKLAHRAATARR